MIVGGSQVVFQDYYHITRNVVDIVNNVSDGCERPISSSGAEGSTAPGSTLPGSVLPGEPLQCPAKPLCTASAGLILLYQGMLQSPRDCPMGALHICNLDITALVAGITVHHVVLDYRACANVHGASTPLMV
jgi:hypothetical protein